MPVLISGTLCTDTIETPAGRADRVLGGSGAYAAVAASLVTSVRLVGAVGDDFPGASRDLLASRPIDLTGVEVLAGSRNQFWHGRYYPGLHTRDHVDVDMDILDRWEPVVPTAFRDSTHVFLGHTPPRLQHAVLDQVPGAAFVLADTIDHWIATQRDAVLRLFRRVSAVVVNDGEAELLTGTRDVLRAARELRQLGPAVVLVKKGEHGVVVHTGDTFAALPAVPVEDVSDPTGAGDTFAGALAAGLSVGWPLPRAVAAGVVAAGFTVAGFGLARLAAATPAEFNDRLAHYRDMLAI